MDASPFVEVFVGFQRSPERTLAALLSEVGEK